MRIKLCLAACLFLAVGLLSACADDDVDGSLTQTGSPWFDEVKPAAAAGSAAVCAIPVALPLAAKWLAKPVRLSGGTMDVIASQGGATLACELDAKPAGHLGFERVWIAKRDVEEPRAALEAFLSADTGLTGLAYRELKAGRMPAVEATYLRTSELEKSGKRERAFAVEAPEGIAIVTLSGLNNEQYQAMLPAYALARRDITPA